MLIQIDGNQLCLHPARPDKSLHLQAANFQTPAWLLFSLHMRLAAVSSSRPRFSISAPGANRSPEPGPPGSSPPSSLRAAAVDVNSCCSVAAVLLPGATRTDTRHADNGSQTGRHTDPNFADVFRLLCLQDLNSCIYADVQDPAASRASLAQSWAVTLFLSPVPRPVPGKVFVSAEWVHPVIVFF